jgi:hypothetical protein
MVNERSLANLRGPKPKKEGYGYRYCMPQEKIDELFTYLAEGISLKQAAKKAKMCFETARKYFRRGDEKRGIKPLQWRLTIFQDKISEKYNVLLVERRAEMVDILRTSINSIKEKIKEKQCKFCEGTGIQTGKDEIKIACPVCKGEGKIMGSLMDKSSLRDLDRLIRLEVFLLGGVTQKEKERKMLSAEEIAGGDNNENS